LGECKSLPTLSIDVSVSPSATPGADEVSATIRNAETDEILSAPNIIFQRGQEAKTSTTLPNGAEIRLSITVSDSKPEVRYQVELVDRHKSVVLQKATLKLGS
jgi:hypothetical protein